MQTKRYDPRSTRLAPLLTLGLGIVGACALLGLSREAASGWFMVWFGATIVLSIRSERFAHAPYTCPECRTQIPTLLDGQTKRYYCSRCEVIWDTRVRKYDGNWD